MTVTAPFLLSRPSFASLARLVGACLAVAAAGAQAAPGAPGPAGAEQAQLGAQLRWIPASLGPGHVTLDHDSRLLLSRAAAERAGLQEVGLDFRDVYGLINAESSWVPRTGMGRNGVPSHGLGQFEPATARAVGLADANDPVAAVHAAARLMKEAAVWSAQRIARLGLAPAARAAKLREGVSVYYNLSSKARSAWTGTDLSLLPQETLRHIRNVHAGARQADQLNARLGGPKLPALPTLDLPSVASLGADRASARSQAVRTASVVAQPQVLGTIEWSGKGDGGPAAGRRSYVVLSNGILKPQAGGAVPNGGVQWTRRVSG